MKPKSICLKVKLIKLFDKNLQGCYKRGWCYRVIYRKRATKLLRNKLKVVKQV